MSGHDKLNAALRRRGEQAPPEPEPQPAPVLPSDIDAHVRGEPIPQGTDMNLLLRRAAGREPAFDIRELRRDQRVV